MSTNTNSLNRSRASRARGLRLVWSSLILAAAGALMWGWGKQRDIDFQNNPVLSNPFAHPYVNTWTATGKLDYLVAELLFAAALIGLLIGIPRVLKGRQ